MVDRNILPPGLLEEVKNHLDITWDNEATDNKIRSLIASGMSYINKKYGGEADYVADGMPRTLLFEYVRYGRDSALDVFENNYRSFILDMQNERRVGAYVERTTQTEK